MSDAFVGYLLAVVALVLFSLGILLAKVASSRISLSLGFLIAVTSNVLFSALAFGVQLLLHPEGVQWNGRGFMLFALAGAFSTYLGRWFFYEAVVRFGPSRASVFQVSSPLFTAIIAWLWLGENLTILMVAGMALTIGGLVLVSYKPGAFSATPAASAIPAIPVEPANAFQNLHQFLLQSVLMLGLGSSLAYAIGNVMRGSGVRVWNEPILGALVGALIGLALHVAFSSGRREMLSGLRTANRSGALLYALLGVCTIFAQMCAIGAMRYIPLSIATLITLCTPVLVFPLSHMLFKNSENINRTTLVGCALALLGIFIIVLR